jgi:hypothetical protein
MATSPKYGALLAWARSNDAVISETLSFQSEPTGCCRTTVPVAKGTQLFDIPRKIIITAEVACKALPQLVDLPVHAQLCAFLAYERRQDGFWKPYLDSLPENFETPPYFDEKELNILEGTNLGFAWTERRCSWKEEFEKARKVIRRLSW